MRFCKITVWDHRWAETKSPKKYVVKAFCLQGETGFRAWFLHPKNKNIVMEAHGDDGFWRVVGEFSKGWLKEYAETFNAFFKNNS